jgi:hypothetical protein
MVIAIMYSRVRNPKNEYIVRLFSCRLITSGSRQTSVNRGYRKHYHPEYRVFPVQQLGHARPVLFADEPEARDQVALDQHRVAQRDAEDVGEEHEVDELGVGLAVAGGGEVAVGVAVPLEGGVELRERSGPDTSC